MDGPTSTAVITTMISPTSSTAAWASINRTVNGLQDQVWVEAVALIARCPSGSRFHEWCG